MKLRNVLLTGASALMLGALAIPANAAPTIGAGMTTLVHTSSADQVNYYRHGRRHYRNYGYAPYYNEGYGYGPGIGLYFGGGGGRGGHWGGGHRGHR